MVLKIQRLLITFENKSKRRCRNLPAWQLSHSGYRSEAESVADVGQPGLGPITSESASLEGIPGSCALNYLPHLFMNWMHAKM